MWLFQWNCVTCTCLRIWLLPSRFQFIKEKRPTSSQFQIATVPSYAFILCTGLSGLGKSYRIFSSFWYFYFSPLWYRVPQCLELIHQSMIVQVSTLTEESMKISHSVYQPCSLGNNLYALDLADLASKMGANDNNNNTFFLRLLGGLRHCSIVCMHSMYAFTY